MTVMHDSWIDRSAVSLSGLCLVHCLIGSLLLVAVSGVGGFWSHNIHAIGLIIAILLAGIALYRGVQEHGRWLVAGFGLAGVTLMSGALFQDHGDPMEVILTVSGVSLLAMAHLLNLRWKA